MFSCVSDAVFRRQIKKSVIIKNYIDNIRHLHAE